MLAEARTDRSLANGASQLDAMALGRNGPPVAKRAASVLPSSPVPSYTATAFEPFEASAIPPRQFIFGYHFLRRYLSMTGGAGGVSKSMREGIDAISMVVGYDLLGRDRVFGGPKRVWLLNLEDDFDEIRRRIAAICIQYGVDQSALGGLFIDSGREKPLLIASESRDGLCIHLADIELLKAEIKARQIDVLIVDPFVESHSVSESLNDHMKVVMAQWRQIAHECNIAVELCHHIRKNGGNDAAIDDIRGAGALVGSARSVRLISPMSEADAQMLGIEPKERRRYVSVNPFAKTNFAAPSDARDWFHLQTIALPNATDDYPDGDRVGVPVPWKLPSALADVSVDQCHGIASLAFVQKEPWNTARVSPQAAGWFGVKVADHLDMNAGISADRKKITRILSQLVKEEWLEHTQIEDQNRELRPVFVAGKRLADQ